MDDIHSLGKKDCWYCKPEKASPPAFRVRIKLNTKETERRLGSIQSTLYSMRNIIKNQCQVMEPSGRLELALRKANEQLLIAMVALRAHSVGERQYMGDAVMLYEELSKQLFQILGRATPYQHKYRSRWRLLSLQANGLADHIGWSFAVLDEMRKQLNNDTDAARFRQVQSSTWTAWFVDWMCVLTQRKKTSENGGRKQLQDHHEREHLFTNKTPVGTCTCLDYR